MSIMDLIESIAENSKDYDRFYFTVIDTNSPWGIFTENKFIHKTDDAIAFLFDADIYLWQLVSVNIQQDGGLYGLMTTWNITLRR